MNKNKILIVEDEEAIAKMIAINLKVSGYETMIFNTGDEAAESLKEKNDYDLAIMEELWKINLKANMLLEKKQELQNLIVLK